MPRKSNLRTGTAAGVALWLLSMNLQAQQPGRAPAGPPPAAKAAAPIDLTGYWVSQIVDEWRFRVTPQKGDILYLPLKPEAERVALAWDPDKDETDGNQCRAYGAVGVMQRPGRLHITWADDNTLRFDFDSGNQSRMLHFKTAADKEDKPGPPSWQGYSEAKWNGPRRGRGGVVINDRLPGQPAAGRAGTLEVVTTDMSPGYIRKNGVPYSGQAVLREYMNRLDGDQNDAYLVVTAEVDDPAYLTEPFVRSYTFKKQADASGWEITPCWTK
jgi:hypothetical protein